MHFSFDHLHWSFFHHDSWCLIVDYAPWFLILLDFSIFCSVDFPFNRSFSCVFYLIYYLLFVFDSQILHLRDFHFKLVWILCFFLPESSTLIFCIIINFHGSTCSSFLKHSQTQWFELHCLESNCSTRVGDEEQIRVHRWLYSHSWFWGSESPSLGTLQSFGSILAY